MLTNAQTVNGDFRGQGLIITLSREEGEEWVQKESIQTLVGRVPLDRSID